MAHEAPTVADVMEKAVLVVQLDSTASECARAMSKRGVSCAVIMEQRNAVGIVTERDLVSKVMADALEPKKVLVRDIMSTPLITITPEALLTDAAELMSQYRIRRLIVVGNGQLRGIITAGDIARSLAEKQEYKDATLNAIARYSEGIEDGPYR